MSMVMDSYLCYKAARMPNFIAMTYLELELLTINISGVSSREASIFNPLLR
jgi:hypothetical protein